MPANDRVIYGLSCACHAGQGVRYVGMTSKGLPRRLRQHERDAQKATANRMHLWMREHEVVGEVLEEVAPEKALRVAEIQWMGRLRGQGASLLNGTDFWAVVDGVWQRSA